MIYYIYKIVCNDVSITDFYVGSTSNIRNRKYQHKNRCNTNEKSKIYQNIRDNGGWDNWRMVVLEEMDKETTLIQSRIREEHYRLELQANLNMRNCGTSLTKEEYRETHKEQISNTGKIRYESKKEELKAKSKAYYEANKDEINRKKREARALKKQTNNNV